MEKEVIISLSGKIVVYSNVLYFNFSIFSFPMGIKVEDLVGIQGIGQVSANVAEI